MITSNKEKYDRITENFWSNADYMLKEKGMTWRELADKLSLDPRTLSSKKSVKCNISMCSAMEMAEAIGTSVERLIYGRPENL